jgi:hypothetical protein
MRTIAAVIFAGASLVAGCLVPIGSAARIDPAAAAQLAKDVPLYESPQLTSSNHIKLGSLSVSDCDNGMFGGPGQEGVVATLRQRAKSIGANGITDLSCGHAATDERSMLGGCYSAMACSATALKVVPAESSAN